VATPESFDRNIDIIRHMASSTKFSLTLNNNFYSGPDLGEPGQPAIASNGEDFLVATCTQSPDKGIETCRHISLVQIARSEKR
jgi:hypothetical protein